MGKIEQYVEITNTTDKETVERLGEKLDKDFEEEFLLNEQMEELMLDDEMSAELNDSCPEDMVELVPVESTEEIVYVPDSNSKEKKTKTKSNHWFSFTKTIKSKYDMIYFFNFAKTDLIFPE